MMHFHDLHSLCFCCDKPQHNQVLVYFGPGRFVKCHHCGPWLTLEWALGEALIEKKLRAILARPAAPMARAPSPTKLDVAPAGATEAAPEAAPTDVWNARAVRTVRFSRAPFCRKPGPKMVAVALFVGSEPC